MIEHINLLDKVFYTYNKCVYEVTIVSKVYNRCNAVNIIFNDEIKPVNIKNLYYTNDEAYKRVLEDIKEEIALQEKYAQAAQNKLTELYNKRKCILNKLEKK